jgi:molybdopterin converting factor small subunit
MKDIQSMSGITVIIPALIRGLTNGQNSVVLPAGTISECLFRLTEKFPDLKKKLYKDDGAIAHNVNFFVNKTKAGIDDALKPGDELMIFFAAAGG